MIENQLKKFAKNNDAKVLLSNFFALGFLQLAGYVFPLLTLPYLAKTIGVEKFGELAFASAIMIYFQTLVDYGFIFSAVRDIARCKEDKKAVSEIYSRIMWARFFLVIVSFAILLILVLIVSKFREMKLLILLTFLIVPGHALFPDWMFQAFEKMKYITVFHLIIKFVFTVSVFLFIKTKEDYVIQPILSAVGFLLCGIISMCVIRSWGIRFSKPKNKVIISTIKENTDLFINQLAPNLYNSFSTLLLGFTHGELANGILDAGNKFGTIAANLLGVISRTFFPFLSRKIDKHNLFVKINLGIAILMSIVLFIFAPFIIQIFYTAEFTSAINVLRIIAISFISLALSQTYSTNYLIIKGYEREARQITLIASGFGFVIAVPFVYYFSYIGVALVILISRTALATMIIYKVKMISCKQ